MGDKSPKQKIKSKKQQKAKQAERIREKVARTPKPGEKTQAERHG